MRGVGKIKVGDVILANVNDQPFHAYVTKPLHEDPTLKRKVLSVEPIEPRITYHSVTPRQVHAAFRRFGPGTRKEGH